MSEEMIEFGTCGKCGNAGQLYENGCEHCLPEVKAQAVADRLRLLEAREGVLLHVHTVLGIVMGEDVYAAIEKLKNEPRLGLATTRELLAELTARIEVNGTIDYRTVDEDREVDGG